MRLTLTRSERTDQSTLGDLSIDGYPECVTLEPAKPIPAGIYRITIYKSPRLGYDVLLLHDVPGHTFVEIHVGNFPKDTDLCILVGKTKGHDLINSSRDAFRELMAKVVHRYTVGEAVSIEIRDIDNHIA